jgi:hypothetical protein
MKARKDTSEVVPAVWWTIYVDYTGLGVTVLHTLKQCHKAMQAAWNQNLFVSLGILHMGKRARMQAVELNILSRTDENNLGLVSTGSGL